MKNSYKLILISVLVLIIALSGCKSGLKVNTDNKIPENEIENKEPQSPDDEKDKNSGKTKESIIEKYKLEGIVFNDDYTAIIKYPETKEDEEFIVPDFIKEIGSEAFKEHKYIKTVVLPEGLTRIDWSAFQKSSLEKINIPDSVTEIGDFAFFDCANLTDVNASEDMIEKILWGRYCLMFTPFSENYAEKKFEESGDKAKLDSYSTNIPYDTSISYKTNHSASLSSGGQMLYDDDYMYYINDRNLYRINKQGKEKQLLTENKTHMLFLYNNEIYYSGQDISDESYGIFHLDKNELKSELILSDYSNSFVIIKDKIIYDKYVEADSSSNKNRFCLYSYDIYTKESYLISNNLLETRDSKNVLIYNDKIIYSTVGSDNNELLMQYDIDENKSDELKFNESDFKDLFVLAAMQTYNSEIYGKFDDGIYKIKIDDTISREQIMPRLDEKGYIYQLQVTDNYIFFFTSYFLLPSDVHYFHVFRMKHDGTEITNIYDSKHSRTDGGSTGSYSSMYVIEDKIFLFNHGQKMTVLDFDGNVLDWDI